MEKEIEIEFRKVTKKYNNKILALEDASFSIEKGEFVFIVGKSGSGKSTLLKLLSGQEMPTSGNVIIGKKDTQKLNTKEIPYFRRQFGIMDTEIGLLQDKTVYENIDFPLIATEVKRKIRKKRIEKTLSTVGIANKANFFPEEISVGEAARVLLARAIVTNPKIMVIDEPTANISGGMAWDMMYLLEELNRLGITMIVASHSRELVTIMKKRVITLVSGAVVSDEKNSIYDEKKMDVFEEKRVAYEREKSKK